MYVAVKGGDAAISAAHAWLAQRRRGDEALPELSADQIAEQLGLAVDRVMAEGSCHDRDLAALAIKQARGDLIEAEAITHHAGDAPDLMFDEGIERIFTEVDPATRAPGVHIMTGPIYVEGAEPGDMLEVRYLQMVPRNNYGSNLAANWGSVFVDAGPQGHLNADSDLGWWQDGQALLDRVLDAASDRSGRHTPVERHRVLAVYATDAAQRHYLGAN